ncbi:MAG: hypothetical protein WCD70_12790 [Alphaproteobacteria bacterium]
MKVIPSDKDGKTLDKDPDHLGLDREGVGIMALEMPTRSFDKDSMPPWPKPPPKGQEI